MLYRQGKETSCLLRMNTRNNYCLLKQIRQSLTHATNKKPSYGISSHERIDIPIFVFQLTVLFSKRSKQHDMK